MADTQSSPIKGPFEVLLIQELQRTSKLQGLEKYYRHRIETRGGTVMTVDIGENDFTPEKVKVILTERAENADRILKL